MKVTVCQIDPREEYLDHYLASLTDHVKSEKSDFVLLPEMGFSGWLAVDKTPDPNRWSEAVDNHVRYIDKLGALGAKAAMGTRPIINAVTGHVVWRGNGQNGWRWGEQKRDPVGLFFKRYAIARHFGRELPAQLTVNQVVH